MRAWSSWFGKIFSDRDLEKVTRFEVISEGTGRVYVRGAPYGEPVTVECFLQDEGRTLKVFVKSRKNL